MKNALFFILLVLLSNSTNAQNIPPIVNRTPDFPKIATPNAAAFNKYVDNPVGLYSGNVDFGIPLFSLKDGAIELPITLRYNSSGIKVEEEASWVGLGWNLNVGGLITQYCVGGYDAYDTHFLKLFKYLEFDIFAIPNYYHYRNIDKDTYLNSYFGNDLTDQRHTTKFNPDVFYYSYPGGCGKFFIDYRDNSIHQVCRENNIKIEILNNTTNDRTKSFKITTEDGISHSFKYFSNLYDQYDTTKEVSLSYVLYQTTYPNGQVVDYQYTKCPVFQRNFSQVYIANTYPGKTFIAEKTLVVPHGYDSNSYEQHTRGEEFYLSRISTTNYIVNFSLSNRLDLENGKKLDAISIAGKNQGRKEFRFSYDYFTSDTSIGTWENGGANRITPATTDLLIKRLKLLSVYESFWPNLENNKYDFTYNETALPPKHSFAVDYWGNSNLSKQATYMPQFEYLLWGRPELKTVTDHFIELVYNPESGITKVGDRSYDFQACSAAMLNGISYPTGGYQQFTYEPNAFIHYFIPTKSQIEEIKSSTKNILCLYQCGPKPFTLTKKTKIKLTLEVIRGFNTWQAMKGSGACVLYANNGDNATSDLVLEYVYPDENENSVVFRTKEFELEPGDYIFSPSIPYQLGEQGGVHGNHGSANATISYDEPVYTATNEVEVHGCGVRIKTIDNYEYKGADIPLKSTSYEYLNPVTGISSGILHEDLRFHREFYNEYVLSPCTSPNNYYYAEIPQMVLYSNNVESNPYSIQAPVGYSCVKEVTKGINGGYTFYTFHNKGPEFEQHSVRVDDCLNGKLIRKECYNNKSLIIKEIFQYEKSTIHEYGGINVIDPFNMFPGVFANGLNMTCSNDASLYANVITYYSRLMLLAHRLNSYDVTLKSRETISDGVVVKEKYNYDPLTLQLKEKVNITSLNDTIKHIYLYPNNYNSDVYGDMRSSHMLNLIVEERIYKNNYLIGGIHTEYGTSKANRIIPRLKYFSEINSPLANRDVYSFLDTSIFPVVNVEYIEYDSYSNPVYIKHNDTSQVVYLWGYGGQYLVAEIKNATYDDVKTALGCAPESLSSSLSYDSRIDNLRTTIGLSHSQVITYKYKPLVGLIEMINERGISTFYDYDNFGRLEKKYLILDNKTKIIEQHEYHTAK